MSWAKLNHYEQNLEILKLLSIGRKKQKKERRKKQELQFAEASAILKLFKKCKKFIFAAEPRHIVLVLVNFKKKISQKGKFQEH